MSKISIEDDIIFLYKFDSVYIFVRSS